VKNVRFALDAMKAIAKPAEKNVYRAQSQKRILMLFAICALRFVICVKVKTVQTV
jgi:hypothetical protein